MCVCVCVVSTLRTAVDPPVVAILPNMLCFVIHCFSPKVASLMTCGKIYASIRITVLQYSSKDKKVNSYIGDGCLICFP